MLLCGLLRRSGRPARDIPADMSEPHPYCLVHDQPLEWCSHEEITQTCRHGIPVTDRDAARCAFYENPEHLKVSGPGRKRS